MKKKLILIFFVLFIGASLVLFFKHCAICEYENKFLAMDGVLSVSDFSAYEEHLWVSLNLDRGTMRIAGFDESIFKKPNYVGLLQMGDIKVKCVNSQGYEIGGGFDLIGFVKHYTELKNISNFQDMVNNYQDIYTLIIICL